MREPQLAEDGIKLDAPDRAPNDMLMTAKCPRCEEDFHPSNRKALKENPHCRQCRDEIRKEEHEQRLLDFRREQKLLAQDKVKTDKLVTRLEFVSGVIDDVGGSEFLRAQMAELLRELMSEGKDKKYCIDLIRDLINESNELLQEAGHGNPTEMADDDIDEEAEELLKVAHGDDPDDDQPNEDAA